MVGSSGRGSPPAHTVPPTAAPPLVESRSCVLCSASSVVFPGLECVSQDPHFVCEGCLGAHLLAAAKTPRSNKRLQCPVPGCRSEPWPFTAIAQHVPEDLFSQYLQEGGEQREAALRRREARLLEEGAGQEAALRRREAELEAERARLSRQPREPWALPTYWSGARSEAARWRAVPVTDAERAALRKVLKPSPRALGGRDQRLAGPHTGFRLGAAWRIENHDLYAKFAVEKRRLKSIGAELGAAGTLPTGLARLWGMVAGTFGAADADSLRIREEFIGATRQLPGELEAEVNEVYLLHGTKPETVLSVVARGMNERFSGGLFGHGTYFAEDIAKNDQYVTEDAKLGDHQSLHRELYGRVRHPGKVFYVFLCRVAMGHFCRTRDAATNMDTRGGLWSSNQRELAAIPGTSPPEPFHGLVAETGGRIQRHREFISFHGDRVYPEYLLAYQRV